MSFDLSSVTDITIPEGSVESIESSGTIIWQKQVGWKGLKMKAVGGAASVFLFGFAGYRADCQYSEDEGLSWENMPTREADALRVPSGATIYVRGVNPSGWSVDSSHVNMLLVPSGEMELSGSIMSLIDGVGESKVIPNEGCFRECFLQYTTDHGFINTPSLPATTLKAGCYEGLFWNSSIRRITTALPATTLAVECYKNMFNGCVNLENAPSLPATILKDRCYESMFRGCSTLRVNENGSGTKIFTCPPTTGLSDPVNQMFLSTGGSFSGTPRAGRTYNQY